ncbi:hypothetical protein PAPYR_6677 [Paratrimastix pyriformis]|uniref:C2H2-type domain-containing protein n=1 Tax=Paratrimastix pyriformis TaxID=342808 RepID=A0ABQ8UG49_9EUKA|nr:hypothetical protein PAPYR_6677 [Paratrimastix pyriformis]
MEEKFVCNRCGKQFAHSALHAHERAHKHCRGIKLSKGTVEWKKIDPVPVTPHPTESFPSPPSLESAGKPTATAPPPTLPAETDQTDIDQKEAAAAEDAAAEDAAAEDAAAEDAEAEGAESDADQSESDGKSMLGSASEDEATPGEPSVPVQEAQSEWEAQQAVREAAWAKIKPRVEAIQDPAYGYWVNAETHLVLKTLCGPRGRSQYTEAQKHTIHKVIKFIQNGNKIPSWATFEKIADLWAAPLAPRPIAPGSMALLRPDTVLLKVEDHIQAAIHDTKKRPYILNTIPMMAPTMYSTNYGYLAQAPQYSPPRCMEFAMGEVVEINNAPQEPAFFHDFLEAEKNVLKVGPGRYILPKDIGRTFGVIRRFFAVGEPQPVVNPSLKLLAVRFVPVTRLTHSSTETLEWLKPSGAVTFNPQRKSADNLVPVRPADLPCYARLDADAKQRAVGCPDVIVPFTIFLDETRKHDGHKTGGLQTSFMGLPSLPKTNDIRPRQTI